MSFRILSRFWCDIALNVHDMTEDTSDDCEVGLCDISEQLFITFPECDKIILLRNFNAKLK